MSLSCPLFFWVSFATCVWSPYSYHTGCWSCSFGCHTSLNIFALTWVFLSSSCPFLSSDSWSCWTSSWPGVCSPLRLSRLPWSFVLFLSTAPSSSQSASTSDCSPFAFASLNRCSPFWWDRTRSVLTILRFLMTWTYLHICLFYSWDWRSLSLLHRAASIR